MITTNEIRQFWREGNSQGFEDYCFETGRNVVRVLLEAAEGEDRIGIYSGALSDEFYKELAPDFAEVMEHHSVAAVVRDYAAARASELGRLLSENGSLFPLPSGCTRSSNRFLVVGDHSFRAIASQDPYRAISYRHRPDLATPYFNQFLYLRGKCTSPPAPSPVAA